VRRVREVSDAFLLNIAEVTAALAGLFLVGIFFFVESGFRGRERAALEPYFRSGARIVLILFSFPLLLSMTLVVMDPVWSHLLFALLSVLLIAANVDSVRKVRVVGETSRILWIHEWIGTVLVAFIVALPWILGGIDPSREDLTWSIFFSFAVGFLSVSAIVLAAFDVARLDSGD
jgi:hypothetical protein